MHRDISEGMYDPSTRISARDQATDDNRRAVGLLMFLTIPYIIGIIMRIQSYGASQVDTSEGYPFPVRLMSKY